MTAWPPARLNTSVCYRSRSDPGYLREIRAAAYGGSAANRRTIVTGRSTHDYRGAGDPERRFLGRGGRRISGERGLPLTTLKASFASYEGMKPRPMRIARGEHRISPREPKVWFTSTDSFAKVLSTGNRDLLRAIAVTTA
jgi:hypothetical protein